MEKTPSPEGGLGEQEFASLIEKLKSKMPWVKSGERTPKAPKKTEPPKSKDVEFLIEPRKDEKFLEYMQKRLGEEQLTKAEQAKADVAEKIRLYEKYKSSMDEAERKFHEARIKDDETNIAAMEKEIKL